MNCLTLGFANCHKKKQVWLETKHSTANHNVHAIIENNNNSNRKAKEVDWNKKKKNPCLIRPKE